LISEAATAAAAIVNFILAADWFHEKARRSLGKGLCFLA
jgi:hypothetical protein